MGGGVRGIQRRDADADRIVAAVEAVDAGLVALDPDLAATVLPRGGPPRTPPRDGLTAREQQVLELMAEGLPNKTIADRLGISEHTVKFHVNSILAKLGVQSRTEAVVSATRLGLILL